jgi:intracellular multiplication protein IcmP
MRSPPHPRAAWPSGDDNTGFNLIVILLGCCVGTYVLWTSYHGEISAGVMALRHHEIGFIQYFTDRYDLADRQMAAADPNAVTLRDLYGISHAVGMFFRVPAAVFMLLLAAICTVRAAPARFKRAFDLDGLIGEQAATFRTSAAFVRRHLRLVPPGGACPRIGSAAGSQDGQSRGRPITR